jgi:hypothetical protein
MDYEPLLPIEKRLITWSLLLGIGLLGLLIWVSGTFFAGSKIEKNARRLPELLPGHWPRPTRFYFFPLTGLI